MTNKGIKNELIYVNYLNNKKETNYGFIISWLDSIYTEFLTHSI